MMEKKNKTKEVDNILPKKVLDVQKKMKSHALNIHNKGHSNPSCHRWKTKQPKPKGFQTAPHDTNGAPLAMTKTTQIRLPQYDMLPPWSIYGRNRWLHHHVATSIMKQLELQICSASNHRVSLPTQMPLVEEMYNPPMKQMKDNFQTLYLRSEDNGNFKGKWMLWKYNSIVGRRFCHDSQARIVWSSGSYICWTLS